MKATIQFFNTTKREKWSVTKTFNNAYHIDRYIDVVTSKPDRKNMSHVLDEVFIPNEVDAFFYQTAQEFKKSKK